MERNKRFLSAIYHFPVLQYVMLCCLQYVKLEKVQVCGYLICEEKYGRAL